MTVKIKNPLGHSGSHINREGKGLSWGDNGYVRPNSGVYKENLDKVDFSDLKEKKRSFRVKVNGAYQDDHLYEPSEK